MRKVYLDYNATYPLSDHHIKEVMAELMLSDGNPSSTHFAGRKSRSAIEASRKAVSSLIGCAPSEIFFNSGATEGNNSILKCVGLGGKKPTYVICEGDHSSVYETARYMQEIGLINLVMIPLKKSGLVDVDYLIDTVTNLNRKRDGQILVSLMFVNNETGIINPVSDLSHELKKLNEDIFIHIDAVQALGKIDHQMFSDLEIDSASFSAHKIGGFKGVGCIYLKKGRNVGSLLNGGGQERSLRSGTENVPGIISFGLRAGYISKNRDWMSSTHHHYHILQNGLEKLGKVEIHGDPEFSSRNTINFHIPGMGLELLNMRLDMVDIAVSNGSACSSGVAMASRTLVSMGYGDFVSKNSIRVSLGPETCLDDVNLFTYTLSKIIG